VFIVVLLFILFLLFSGGNWPFAGLPVALCVSLRVWRVFWDFICLFLVFMDVGSVERSLCFL
jgi:hypothetical protein